MKYLYFYEHLDNILELLKKEEHGDKISERLLFLIKELEWKNFITEQTTIEEVRELLQIFIYILLDGPFFV